MLNLIIMPVWALALAIFGLRVVDMSLDTLRVLFIIRGNRPLSWVFGFFQSLVWVIAISSVLSNMEHPLNLLAYASGFATGGVVGMWLEEKMAVGYGHLRIMSPNRGAAVATALRGQGYAATELSGRGKDGTVSVINSSVRRRDISKVRRQVEVIDPEAFVTVQEIRPLNRGFWRA